jgi:glycosyltransferase involved in cell wall biosynthesis
VLATDIDLVPMKYSLITTCKGRLHHLKQTLPKMIAQGFHEVIVVDYDCPDGTADWVRSNHSSVNLVKVNNERLFNLSKARNVGAKHSIGDVLCFVDADIEIASGFLEWFNINLSQNKFYLLEPQKLLQGDERLKGLYGLVVCTREQFEAIGGYDDVIAGWGGEDLDFYWRLKKAGYDAKLFPRDIVHDIIQHDDTLRTSYYSQDKEMSDLVAGYYVAAKYKLENLLPSLNISCDVKESLYNQAVAAGRGKVIEFQVPSNANNHAISFSLTEAEMSAIKKTMRKTIKPSSKTKKTKKTSKWKIPLYLVSLIRPYIKLVR